MRILTVRQPWAWAIIHGGKDVENRVRNIAGAYRGPVAIHVARTEDRFPLRGPIWDAAIAAVEAAGGETHERVFMWNLGTPDPRRWLYDHGHIIGVVDLVAVHYSADCYHASVKEAGRLFLEDREAFKALPVRNGAGGLIGRAGFCSGWAMDEHHHLVLADPRPLAEPIPYRGALGLRTLDADTIARIEAQL